MLKSNTEKKVEKIVSTIITMELKLSIYQFMTLNLKNRISVYYIAYYEQNTDTLVFKCDSLPLEHIYLDISSKNLRLELTYIVGKLLRTKNINKTFKELSEWEGLDEK